MEEMNEQCVQGHTVRQVVKHYLKVKTAWLVCPLGCPLQPRASHFYFTLLDSFTKTANLTFLALAAFPCH